MRYKITTLKDSRPHCYNLWASSLQNATQKATLQDSLPPLQVQPNPLISLPISTQDIITSLKLLHLMLKASIPLQECILSISQHSPHKRLAKIYADIDSSLQKGFSLYESFAPHEKTFGKLTLVMIEFGSRSGKLTDCLNELIAKLEENERDKKAFKKALSYPIFVLLCTFTCFTFLLQFVVPQFTELFAQNQLSLPIYTKFLIILSDGIDRYALPILIIFLTLFLTILFQFKTHGIFYQSLLSLTLKIPIFGKLLLHSYLYRYFFTLSILSSAGIDLLQCVSLSQESIESKSIQNKLALISTALNNGKTLYDGLQESTLFDPLTLSLVLIAQKSGKLDEILQVCAERYQTRIRDTLNSFLALIEPTFTILLGGFVLLLALGIFTPIWNLS